jgi:hypothetical protein
MVMEVIGFSGKPVYGATGLKPPLVRDTATAKVTSYQSGRFGSWWTERELELAVEQGLATMLFKPKPFNDGCTVLYAHQDFIVVPGERVTGSLPLSLPSSVFLQSSTEAYLGVVEYGQALEILESWARILLQEAKASLSHSFVGEEDAYTDAMRARFALAQLPVEKARSLRLEAFTIAILSLTRRSADTSALRLDAKFEFTATEVDAKLQEFTQTLEPSPSIQRA